MKQKLILMMGVPGSGKSTHAKKYLDENTVIISRDSLREMIRGEYVFDDKYEPFIKDLDRYAIKKALEDGFSVIVDETNVFESSRLSLVAVAEEMGVESWLIWVITDIDTAKDRRRDEPRVYEPGTWDVIIDKHNEILQEPQDDEISKYAFFKIIRNS
jgi:tRNA uridine 5-carbamoylmethylation protein Kti12